MKEALDKLYLNNTVENYLIAIGFIVFGLLILKGIKKVLLSLIRKWTAKTTTNLDDYIVKSIESYGLPVLYFSIIYVGLKFLTLSEKVSNIVHVTTVFIITFFVIRFVSATILLLLREFLKRKDKGEEKVKQIGGLMLIINVIIWGIGFIFIFDNLGYNVTTIIAGLGIGGIAIALAAQSILGDLFNYFVIFLDRPFEIGDFIVIDDKKGVVDNIGIKTTRVKSLSGEELIFSNSDLTNSRIHNFRRMQRRRIVFAINVAYSTSPDLMKVIPPLIKNIVSEQMNVEFDRAHFLAFGESSLNFEVVYHVLGSDYLLYADIQQSINFRIFEEFTNLGISFGLPTRTVFISPNSLSGNESLSFLSSIKE